MERYKIALIDRAHNAATGIEVEQLEGVYTRLDIAQITSYDGGSAYIAIKNEWKKKGYSDLESLTPYWRAIEAFKAVAKEDSKEVILIEDTNFTRPARLTSYVRGLDDLFASSGALWLHYYNPVCPECFLDLYEEDERVNGLKGFVVHKECPKIVYGRRELRLCSHFSEEAIRCPNVGRCDPKEPTDCNCYGCNRKHCYTCHNWSKYNDDSIKEVLNDC